MTKDEILKLALEAGLTEPDLAEGMTDYGDATESIIRFASLVAAAEQNRICALFDQPHMEYFGDQIQLTIRSKEQS